MEAWPNSAVWILVTGYYGRGCGIFITAVKNKDTKKQANQITTLSSTTTTIAGIITAIQYSYPPNIIAFEGLITKNYLNQLSPEGKTVKSLKIQKASLKCLFLRCRTTSMPCIGQGADVVTCLIKMLSDRWFQFIYNRTHEVFLYLKGKSV